MIPLRDINPTRSRPYIAYALMGLNIAIFLYQISLNSSELEAFIKNYAVIPNDITASLAGEELIDREVPVWLTLFSSQFLHGGLLHLGGNMLYLWVFGNNIEDVLGHVRFVIFYLSCGALAAVAQWLFSMDSQVPLLGASGAIAAIMGAYVLRFPKAEILTLLPIFIFFTVVRIPAVFFLGFWFVIQAFSGVVALEMANEGGGVAYWAHAGGFIFGALLGPLMGLLDR